MSSPTYTRRTAEVARGVWLALCFVGLTACGGQTPAAGPSLVSSQRYGTSASPSMTSTDPPQPAAQCRADGPAADVFWLDAPDGSRLQAASIGTGPNVAIFVHESGSEGMCGFWPYASWLASQGRVRAVLFDMCGYGESHCPNTTDADAAWVTNTAAAVASARANGATRVTLIGASMGGIAVLEAAASVVPPVDGVIDLSGETQIRALTSITPARKLAMPVLYAVAPGDAYISVGAMKTVADATPSPIKRFVVAPDNAGHGWEMLASTDRTKWTQLASTVRDWVIAPSV